MTLPKITPRQQDILKLLYQHRFLNRIQIQALLGNKDHKNVNEWLADLREKDYVEWVYSTGYSERTKPAIYFTGINGVRYLKTREDCAPQLVRRLYREKSRSTSFITSCLLLGDYAVTLRAQSTGGVSYDFATSSDFANPGSKYHLLSRTSWQLLFIKHKVSDDDEITTRFLLEILDQTMPLYRIKKRLRDNVAFYFSGDWEKKTRTPFPVLLFVCPALPQLISLKRYTKWLLKKDDDPKDLHIRFTIPEKVERFGVNGGVWEEA
jgi:hypothetical protein